MLQNVHYKEDMIYITQLTRQVLSLLGVWPSHNRRRSTGDRIWKYFLVTISYILIYGVMIPGALFWLIEKRIRVRIQTFPQLLYCIMTGSKHNNMLYREKNIRRCLKHVEEDWRNTSAEARDTMIEYAKIGRHLVMLYAVFMGGSGLSIRSILPFAKGKIVTPQNVTIRPLPCPAYFYFFDIQVSPAYELVFAMQLLAGVVNYAVTTGLYGLAVVFVMHACGQLKILMDLMRNLVEEQWQEKREVNKKLAKMVEHQIRIRSFLHLVESILQQAYLIELMGCTLIVCLLGYFTIMEWENSNSIAMCSYFTSFTSMMVNMFMICYTGEQLTVQAEKVARTSCVLEWYRLPNKEARGIVLVIIMSNVPIKITAGKIMDLSFKTYGNIVKTAMTYFNMLLNLME